MSTSDILIVLFYLVAGTILFICGLNAEAPESLIDQGHLTFAVAGIALMLMGYIKAIVMRVNHDLEQLRTDNALLQNRIEWLEDRVCPEYRESEDGQNH